MKLMFSPPWSKTCHASSSTTPSAGLDLSWNGPVLRYNTRQIASSQTSWPDKSKTVHESYWHALKHQYFFSLNYVDTWPKCSTTVRSDQFSEADFRKSCLFVLNVHIQEKCCNPDFRTEGNKWSNRSGPKLKKNQWQIILKKRFNQLD